MRTQLFKRTFLALAIAACLVSGPNPVAALSAADWQAGRIIDDNVFNFANDLSVDQIQAFLNSKVPNCDTQGTQTSEYGGGTRAQYGTAHGFPPPYVCLKDYYENETTHENNLQGRAVPSGGVSAARIIYNAAQANSINPKVLIVTLQKESSGPLVTDTWPFYSQYRTPMGYACPDTAPCDSQYYGFANQVSNAAAQFRRYANYPANYRHKAGQNNDVRYNPSTSCGSSTVYIATQATASLYNYTPYQPNAGALSGMSDSTAGGTATCGAYGNRNFFWYYNKWFGSTRRDLIRTSNSGVYLVENGQKRAFPNAETFLSYGYRWADVVVVSQSELSSIPEGTVMPYNAHFRDGQLVRGAGTTGVYLVQNGTKRGFANAETFISCGYQWTQVTNVSSVEVGLIPAGTDMPYNVNYRKDGLIRAQGATGVYLVQNGTKRGFANAETFLSYGYQWSLVTNVTAVELGMLPVGTDIPYNVNYRNNGLIRAQNTTGVYLIQNGAKRGFSTAEAFLSYGYQWTTVVNVTSVELGMIPTGAEVVYNVHFRDGKLIRKAGSDGVYLVENGAKRGFPNAQVFLNHGYKWEDVISVSDVEFGSIPTGPDMQ